jgi:hypothetical protein
LRQFEIVATNYPGYETKMVSYRIEALREDIEKLQAELPSEDLAIADDYFALIGLVEQAEYERFTSQRENALGTLRRAKISLENIVARRPAVFGPALEDQDLRLAGSIAWLGKLVDSTRTVVWVKPLVQTGHLIEGTTEFVKESDLPTIPGLVASGTSLFPGR